MSSDKTKLNGLPSVPVSQEEYRITVLRRTLAKRNRDIDPNDPTCRRCRGSGWVWKPGAPKPSAGYYGAVEVVLRRWSKSHAKRPVTVQETKSLQVRYPSEGPLEGSQVNWDRIAENCQYPRRCSVCAGSGEVSAEALMRLSGQNAKKNRRSSQKSVSTEDLVAILELEVPREPDTT